MTTALTTFPGTQAGILMTTATADEDQAILLPHLDTNQSAWSNVLWGTENQVEWECSINLAATDNQKVWAGLKLTNDQLPETDADQAYSIMQVMEIMGNHCQLLHRGILFSLLMVLTI